MNGYERRLLRVINYIHDNPDGDLSLDALSEVAAMSRFHWHRVFHAMTGETCAQAVRRIRLNRAAAWLVQTNWTLEKVAKSAGYPNRQSFSRVFSDAYGLPPASFRKRGDLGSPLMKTKLGVFPMFPVEILQQPERRLAGVPHRGSYLEVGKSFEQVAALFSARGLWPNAQGMVGVYYDDPDATAEAELRSFAGIAVLEGVAIQAPLEPVDLPAGRYAVMHFKGPYAGLKAAYGYLYGEWLAGAGEEPGDHPPVELYLNSPQDTAPEDLLTDVCVPLKG